MSVKLSYFDVTGRGEPIRWILSYGGIDFEDIRVPYGMPTPPVPVDMKTKCRWGQVPLVEFEGKSLVQTLAICRFFARKVGLVPEDPFQAALCDEYVDATGDIATLLWPVVFLPDGDDKKVKMAETVGKVKTRFFDVFEKIIKDNGGKHLVGDKLTWADIAIGTLLDQFQLILHTNLAEGYEHVNKVNEMVRNTPKIKEWIANRPKTMF